MIVSNGAQVWRLAWPTLAARQKSRRSSRARGQAAHPAPRGGPHGRSVASAAQSWMAGKEIMHLAGAFLVEQRADDIDQRPARLDQRRRDAEQAALGVDEPVDPSRGQPPARLGIAPPRAGARTGRVDQHDIGAAVQSASASLSLFGLSSRVSMIDTPARSARCGKPRQAPAIGVGGEDRARDCPSPRPAPATCRPAPAHRSITAMPGARLGGERDDLAAERPAPRPARCEMRPVVSIDRARSAGADAFGSVARSAPPEIGEQTSA